MSDKLSPLAVSAAEAARLLGISRPTLYQLLNREDFPSFRVGNRVLVSVAGLQEWIDRQTKEVAQ
jgi:excisionase family DNA binding protein